jgi:ParB family chromosome partitioning protein
MDLRKWWTPSAAGYFGRIPREASLKALAEGASAEAATRMDKLKRKPLAQEAEKALAGTGWMPEFLRASWVPPASQGA